MCIFRVTFGSMSLAYPPQTAIPRRGVTGLHSPETGEAEALAFVIGLCVSAEYRLAATDAWGPAALAVLQDTCLQIGVAVRARSIELPVAPPPALASVRGSVAQCVALNDFVLQIRRHCQARLHALRNADTKPQRAPHALNADDLEQLRLAFRRIQRLLAHSGPCDESAALMRQVDGVLARIDAGDLDCDPLWSVLGQAQRTLAALGPRARTLAQAFAQVTHIVGSAHLRHTRRAA